MLILSTTVRSEIMTHTYVSNFIFNKYKIGFNELRHARGELLFKIDGFVSVTLLITLGWGVQNRPWVLEISIQQRKKEKNLFVGGKITAGAFAPPKLAYGYICPTVAHLYCTLSSS
jgi:hypothetical protein